MAAAPWIIARLCLGSMARSRGANRRFATSSNPSSGEINLRSIGFVQMRKNGLLYVDKTGPIADLLGTKADSSRAFFARPRRFGKSLTLEVAAEMLAAGDVPERLQWPGYVPVDVGTVFGGLEVHRRLLKNDPALGNLFRRPHFVIKIALGGAQTGKELKQAIFDELGEVAGSAFDPALKKEVRERSTPAAAVKALVSAVPRDIPVAVLVDEYDAAIVQDVSEQRWAEAKEGIAALRSLMMASKDFGSGTNRIEHFIVTGAARFARVSLFSGANNFKDITALPITSRVLGFSEQEIRRYFPAELVALGNNISVDPGGTSPLDATDRAVKELEKWYNGYYFDGSTTCYNPEPVLTALSTSKMSDKGMEGAATQSWLGLAPAAVLDTVVKQLQAGGVTADTAKSFDIADLEAQSVDAAAMLLQTGLLTVRRTPSTPGLPDTGDAINVAPPNEYARRSLQQLVAIANNLQQKAISDVSSKLQQAVSSRDAQVFMELLRQQLAAIGASTVSPKGRVSEASKSHPPPREAPYHTFAYGLLLGSLPAAVAKVASVHTGAAGVADIMLQLPKLGAAQPDEVWLLEFGVWTPDGNEGTIDTMLAKKLAQAQRYYNPAFASVRGVVAAVVVKDRLATVRWSRWDATAHKWMAASQCPSA